METIYHALSHLLRIIKEQAITQYGDYFLSNYSDYFDYIMISELSAFLAYL